MKKMWNRLFYQLGKWASQLFFLLITRRKTLGHEQVPKSGGVLLIANHQSYLDPMVVGCALRRPCHFMARDTLFTKPIFGWMIRHLNAFPVKRDSADVGALKETLRRLKDGQMVLVFPEGTRSADGRIADFKGGPIAIAQRAQVPIVPVVIEGTHDVWGKGLKWPHPGRIWITFQSPLSSEQLQNREIEPVARELTIQVREQQNLLRKEIGREPFVYNMN
ncbi:MAG: hypothetical protein HJJLKODD_01002 [Phycisphaerae bacterium]|nr:hypothetical protein [Phycisphaerae bacterium]